MKLTLGMITRNEEPMLRKTLPIVAPCFDEIVVVDAYSTDKTFEVLDKHGALIYHRQWDDNFSAARNMVIEKATGDYMFMLDADEAMWPADIKTACRELAAQRQFFSLRRVEFVNDLFHIDPKVAPDYQCRFFRLGKDFKFKGQLHEALFCGPYEQPVCRWPGAFMSRIPIYHYGQTKPRAQTWLRHENYRRLLAGEPLLEAVPDGIVLEDRKDVEEYMEDHPLRPIGGKP
jgi:glycosyltransferase involved in cell wall biosynthesis